MAIFHVQGPLVFTFGILGNIVSFMVYLAPAPTFYKIYKTKSTQEFQSVPYVVALLSSILWIYYASLQSNEVLLITINLVGCIIEALYLAMFVAYAPKKARNLTMKLFLSLNICGVGCIFIVTHFMLKGSQRIRIVGWISVAISASVFIAPLSIMKKVIRTKSVEFMPISLSLALVLSAVMWFSYGLMLKDFYIAVPNVVGLIFGVAQIILYLAYRGNKVPADEAQKELPTTVSVVELEPTKATETQSDQTAVMNIVIHHPRCATNELIQERVDIPPISIQA